MKKKTIIWTIIAIVIVVLLLAIAFIIKQVNHSGDKSSNGYDTYTVKEETPISIEGKASPQSVKIYNNNSQIGTFLSAAVEDGQKVKQGTQLISYNTNASKRTDLANKVDQAQQQVNKDYEEINKSPNNQQFQTKLTQDQSALNDAQQQLSQHDRQLNDSMYAAFDGTINIQNESNVGDGQPILQLISNQPEIKTTVSEFDIDKIKVGDKVNVAINSNGKKGEGKIIKINQLPTSFEDSASSGASASGAASSAGGEQGDEGQASAAQASNPTVNVPSGGKAGEPSKYTVVIGDLDIPVRPGLSLDAKIPLKTMKLPNDVLTKDNQVFVVDKNNKVHKREIKIDRNNGQIIVKKGLKSGDKVLKNPKGNLNDGEKVEVSS
ncbi:efflux RND transporter periplasmic adaptor subunit [Staphylococcus simiae]|uniref:efflux RND transporter periplasmic adaptor subunit n=1 Tax=Staphylococcus simiae TaxID=308354 RepID=UPI001A95BEBF|nr:efflux RND transporter periplasmic adaptor subunit [Staphylococcus simiae]MBO1198230.1 efflux RND transporter periplasmic adaptor subunit [Staphylococcus simiae]MBO1200935.1 efflux RND transporter periplasmic adaptor subunit [Staphylococcus simiae]MBO1203104.1 efflux RND transporter periplasmic adaptor subunit [Staphylococcus simiae]MBO1210222.1 efflux RND transporter periplasmic adaptor subunit [Staphylococcus simiae]MBO1229273.1 efflux RND transporter periplasmic adaptor subunit [Staphylo